MLGLAPEQVLVLSTGVIGVPLPIAATASRHRDAAARFVADGGAAAAQAILTTDTCTKEAVVRAGGLHRRRHGERLGDDPPEPRDDARGRHDRLSARAGRAARIPAASRRRRASTRSRSTANARRTTPSCSSRCGGERAATTRVRRRAARRVRRARAADRRRWRGRDRGSPRSASRGAASHGEARAVARARSRHRRSSRRRCSARTRTGDASLAAAGSAPFNGGYAQLDPTS